MARYKFYIVLYCPEGEAFVGTPVIYDHMRPRRRQRLAISMKRLRHGSDYDRSYWSRQAYKHDAPAHACTQIL